MCGIAVVYGKKDPAFLSKALQIMRHRGPDDSGTFISDTVSFCHARLSIIDVACGKQPIFNEEKDRCIILNGEIYNFRELRDGLEGRHRFTTHSDTEVLLHLYEEKGPDCLHDLSGMFSFAIYDKGKLFVARDRIGIKPLYYSSVDGTMLFASEMKALSGCKEIQEFPPGHYFTPEGGFVQFYELPTPVETQEAPDALFKQLRVAMKDAVIKRLVADVPIGVFLSGGLDSSIVAALMSEQNADLHSFAVGVEGSADLKASREVAQHLGTSHHEYIYNQQEMIDALPDVIYHLESFDAPLVRSAIPCYFVALLARKHLKVILTGEGADELFSGYHYLKEIKDQESLFKELVSITARLHHSNLQRTDRMTMAHSIEGRVPFLDPNVIEFAFNLPMEMRQAGEKGIEKWFLRKTFESYLPSSIVWRRKQKFSEGAGSANLIENVAEESIPDAEFAEESASAPVEVRSKEELYYYRLFRKHFGEPSSKGLVGKTADYSRKR